MLVDGEHDSEQVEGTNEVESEPLLITGKVLVDCDHLLGTSGRSADFEDVLGEDRHVDRRIGRDRLGDEVRGKAAITLLANCIPNIQQNPLPLGCEVGHIV